MLPRPCSVCGKPTPGARCSAHPRPQQAPRQTRGYDRAYDAARRRLLEACELTWRRGDVVSCVICHRPVTREEFSAEHVTPLRAGGGATGNLAAAHKRCNYGWRRRHGKGARP